MAILPMRRISIYGLKKDRKAILEALQRYGVVEVRDIDAKEYNASRIDTTASQVTFMKGMTNAENALSILAEYVPEETSLFSMFDGKKELSAEQYYSYVAEIEESMRAANRINLLSKEISESKAEIIRSKAQLEALSPWLSLDVPISFRGTKKTAAFIGIFPDGPSMEKILTDYAEILAESKLDAEKYAIDVQIISTSSEQTCVFIMCYKPAADKVEDLLRTLGFAKPAVSSKSSPYELSQQVQTKIQNIYDAVNEKENEIMSYAVKRNAIKFLSDYYSMRVDKYKVLACSNQFKRTFAVEGYIPEKDAQRIEKELSFRYNAAVETTAVSEEDEPPVLLKNNAFATPMEGVLETYSLPKKGETDPSFMMAVFYYFLFGLMFSDAGYGILMMLGCGFALLKFKGMDRELKKNIKLFFYCGISTTFWGILFGSFFGDALDVIARTFFGRAADAPSLFPAVWYYPINEPMRMLMFSFLIGIIHLFTGLGMKLYQCIRDKNWKDAVYDVVFWYMLVGGAIIYLMSTEMFISMAQLKFTIPMSVANIAAIIAVIGAVGIAFTGGRSSKNPAKRLAKGLYSLYDITSYLSDILSYSRLLALGLATGVIASVFNMICSMMGTSVIGIIGFIIVFVIGHAVNIGINVLGAYVHTNRLQFVEFFGKFYEGGGRKYAPFSENTKYYNIKEEF